MTTLGYKYTERQKQNISEALKVAMARPDVRQKLSKSAKKRYEDPEERKKQSEAMKVAMVRPEIRKKCSIAAIKRFENPEERRKTSEATKTALACSEVREKMSLTAKKRFEDPEERKKRSRVMKVAMARPEVKEKHRIANTTHGYSKHPLYARWNSMKQRCYNPKATNYKNYGARGILVCEEWLNNPKAFCDWGMANGYKKGLELDRKNNDGNYESGNCRWVTRSINQKNKRRKNKK